MSKKFRIILYLFPLFLVGIFYITQYVWAQSTTVSATIKINICGNFIAESPAEDCDNYDLNGESCVTQGCALGTG